MAPGWLDEFHNACEILALNSRIIAIGRDDWMEQLDQVDAFVWRPVMDDPSMMAEIRTKIPLIEAMGIPCFPNSLMLWLYDDKIRETFFMRQHGYPAPKTFVTFDEHEARIYVNKTQYPLVTKSHVGASSSGVMLLRSVHEAEHLIDRIFPKQTIWERAVAKYYYRPRVARGDFLLARRFRFLNYCPRYAYFQEFIITEKDWRITTLGADLVSVFVRHNRPDDFRASGGGLWQKVTKDNLPKEACDIALSISNRHVFTSMTYDFMMSHNGWVIGELSYAFLLNRVYTDTLFRRIGNNYDPVEAIPIGVMHLQSLRNAIDGCTKATSKGV
jgi:glutathione synthase/RimK-type ligase-like ATP-grasp enzyme